MTKIKSFLEGYNKLVQCGKIDVLQTDQWIYDYLIYYKGSTVV